MEENENIKNAPAPVETGIAPLDRSDEVMIMPGDLPAKTDMPLSARADGELDDPRVIKEIPGDDMHDHGMHGGFASVRGKRTGEGKLVWAVLIVMVFICAAVGVLSSFLTARLMKKGEAPVTITPSDNQSNISAVIDARKQCVAELRCGNTAYGSGIVMKYDKGKIYILTNCHVIGGYLTNPVTPPEISARFYMESDWTRCELIGYSSRFDVAVLTAERNSIEYSNMKYPVIDIDTEEIFSPDISYREGDYVVAIGNAMTQGIASYDGIISRLSDVIKARDAFNDYQYMSVMRTTAAINAGMSGGALFNMEGKLVGISTLRMSSYPAGADNIPDNDVQDTGYAVPVSIVYPIYKQILAGFVNDEKAASLPDISIDSGSKIVLADLGFSVECRAGQYVVISVGNMPPPNVSKGDVMTAIGNVELTGDMCRTVGELLKYKYMGSQGAKLRITFDSGAVVEFDRYYKYVG